MHMLHVEVSVPRSPLRLGFGKMPGPEDEVQHSVSHEEDAGRFLGVQLPKRLLLLPPNGPDCFTCSHGLEKKQSIKNDDSVLSIYSLSPRFIFCPNKFFVVFQTTATAGSTWQLNVKLLFRCPAIRGCAAFAEPET